MTRDALGRAWKRPSGASLKSPLLCGLTNFSAARRSVASTHQRRPRPLTTPAQRWRIKASRAVSRSALATWCLETCRPEKKKRDRRRRHGKTPTHPRQTFGPLSHQVFRVGHLRRYRSLVVLEGRARARRLREAGCVDGQRRGCTERAGSASSSSEASAIDSRRRARLSTNTCSFGAAFNERARRAASTMASNLLRPSHRRSRAASTPWRRQHRRKKRSLAAGSSRRPKESATDVIVRRCSLF